MNNESFIQSRYQPYRLTLHNKIKIIDSSKGKFIIKKEVKDLESLFNYLDSRGFNHYPNIDYQNHNEYVMEYVSEEYLPLEQKYDELAKVAASLHNKTVYFKVTSIDDYKEIRDLIEENITYMDHFYEGMFLSICQKEFQSPSEYLLARNYYKIKLLLDFAKEKLDTWFRSVEQNKFRVSIIHNNLSLDHFIYNSNKSILISWDNYRIDSPVIDIVNLYKKDFFNNNFQSFFETYLNIFSLQETEKDLLFTILNVPIMINLNDKSELKRTQEVKRLIKYLDQTSSLTGPYYSKQEEK